MTQVVDLEFVQSFVRMCDDGYAHGWHERNGGNASYRLSPEEAAGVRAMCADATAREDARHALQVCEPSMAGECLLVTATGSYMRNVADEPAKALGVIELDEQGSAFRVLWGFEGGGRPTSEISSHVLIHAVKKRVTGAPSCVLYHCHPVPIISLCCALPLESRAMTRALWQTMTECVVVFPEGVGVVGCEVPGSLELAHQSAAIMETQNAAIWAHHGLLATGATCDEAFGLIHVIVKAAEIYHSACVLCGGPHFERVIDDAMLRKIADDFGLTVPDGYLS